MAKHSKNWDDDHPSASSPNLKNLTISDRIYDNDVTSIEQIIDS